MGGGAKIFQLLLSEDVDCDKVDFGMPVLASFGSTHLNDFARAVFDDHESVLS